MWTKPQRADNQWMTFCTWAGAPLPLPLPPQLQSRWWHVQMSWMLEFHPTNSKWQQINHFHYTTATDFYCLKQIIVRFIHSQLTSCISSTEMYASVGRPRSLGFTSIMTNTCRNNRKKHVRNDSTPELPSEGQRRGKGEVTYRVGTVLLDELIDGNIILVQLGTCVVPPDYSFSCCKTMNAVIHKNKNVACAVTTEHIWFTETAALTSPLTFLNMPYMFSR